jgi:quercetin dioxygenase-like cupin family protein
VVDEVIFREKMIQDGYGDVTVRHFVPNHWEPTHTHEFGASVLVLNGKITITMEDRTVTCQAGDVFALDANVPHAEQVGDEGVRFLACRK